MTRVVALDKDTKKTKLKDIMSQPVINVEENADLVEASESMRKKNLRRLAVLNKSGKLVGIITADDLARSLRRSAEELALTFHLMSRSKERK